jgi:3-methyl-2-oxobutanoate hydroxymethyltransferase
MAKDKMTVPRIRRMKAEGKKIAALTAYDFCMARILDRCELDILLVGDSVGMVFAGLSSTLPVTMEQMSYHTQAVARARSRGLVVADMPFMSYQVSVSQAKENAGRLIKEGGAEAVKLEGGVAVKETIEEIVAMDVPVMGHVGLTPQSVHRMGGYQLQGRSPDQAKQIWADVVAVRQAGAFSLVLEGIPSSLAQEITAQVDIPTIGIGAGPHCDGQVLVVNDMLGYFEGFKPKFVKRYTQLAEEIARAVSDYVAEVREGKFPDQEHSFHNSR